MKKTSTLLVFILVTLTFTNRAQESAFTSDSFGDLSIIDLTDASQTSVGTLVPWFQGMDFGPENVLYGLDGTTNELYTVDTSDASTTLVASCIPATDHMWTGLAFDYENNIMYANASWGIAAGSSKLYTIDLTDGSLTLIGTQTTVTAIGAIAFDNNGILYGIELSAQPSIYTIDVTDASVTYVGDCGSFGGAGTGYGMDFNDEDETMYLTAYDSFTFNSNLYSIDLDDGSATDIGFLSMWTQSLAIINPFSCEFEADETEICAGTTVNFTNKSSGADSYSWTFEGGTPETSTDEHPSVLYSNGGTFNVELEITDSSGDTKTELKVDYINVLEIPTQASTPEGESEVCTDLVYTYSITEVPYAEVYEWELSPSDAGTLTPDDYEATLFVADDWTGDFTIKVRATNMCGDGDWSDDLDGTVYQSPLAFALEGGGGYCLNGDGVEITLDGSENDIDYELYLDGVGTGNVVEGTGTDISFGLITDEGFYTAVASNDNCDYPMDGQLQVEILFPPLEPGMPAGPEVICEEETSDYTSAGSDDADSYEWEISPEDAGTITTNGLDATVEWNTEFSGTAMISLYGINDCGDGGSSEALEVNVGAPKPEVSGQDLVCDWSDEVYEVVENEGSTYTWEVTGGTIMDGQGTYMITVAWEGEGNGTVSVEEETVDGCSGASEEFEVMIDDCTGIEDNSEGSGVTIYPNPATNLITLSNISAETIQGKILIYSQTGQKVFEGNIENSNEYQIDISDLKIGLYILMIQQENKTMMSKRFIKNQ